MIEFALLSIPLFLMLGGMGEYGWYYYKQALITNALQEAARTGATKKQATGEMSGSCTNCVLAANAAATANLAKVGVTLTSPGAAIVRLPSSGSPCAYELQLNPTITLPRFFKNVPAPTTVKVKVFAYAQGLTCS